MVSNALRSYLIENTAFGGLRANLNSDHPGLLRPLLIGRYDCVRRQGEGYVKLRALGSPWGGMRRPHGQGALVVGSTPLLMFLLQLT